MCCTHSVYCTIIYIFPSTPLHVSKNTLVMCSSAILPPDVWQRHMGEKIINYQFKYKIYVAEDINLVFVVYLFIVHFMSIPFCQL